MAWHVLPYAGVAPGQLPFPLLLGQAFFQADQLRCEREHFTPLALTRGVVERRRQCGQLKTRERQYRPCSGQ